jgi:colanic acid/amylovoran biosynthesis protein
MNVTIINQYAGNKGDRAVLFALCNLLLRNRNDLQIKVATSDPLLWKEYSYYKNNNIEFIPSAWDYENVSGFFNILYFRFIARFKRYTYTIIRENYILFNLPITRFFSNPVFRKSAKDSDVIISVGGHHFTTILSKDLVSDLPFELCIALSLNKNTVLFSQSFGPFEFYKNRNKQYIRLLLNNCKTLFIREKFSIDYLKYINVKQTHFDFVPETVTSLNRIFSNYILPSAREKKVGISIYSTKKRTEKELELYVNSFSQFCNYVIDLNYEVIFFPMELKGTEPDDREMINQIVSKIYNKSLCNIFDRDMETEEHIKEVAKCQYFIGHKTHSVVFALTSGTPLISIEYHPKTKYFMRQFGVEKYSIEDSILSFEILKEKFSELSFEIDIIGETCFKISLQFSSELQTKVNDLF